MLTSTLVEQKILHEVAVTPEMKSRVTSNNNVLYPNHQGWYMKLLTPPYEWSGGERVIAQALVREGRLIFVTLTPSPTECAWKGSSWLMELNALDGKRLSYAPIDVNNDIQFTAADNVMYKGSEAVISGVQQSSLGMVFNSPAIITHNTRVEGKYQAGTGNTIKMLREASSRFSGRMSWKKLH